MIHVRAARPADAEAITAIYAPQVLAGTATFEEEPPTPAVMATRMAAGGTLFRWLVAIRGEAVVAYAYATPFHARAAYRWTAETSIYVADPAQGSGTGRLLYAVLLDMLVAQGFAQAVARIVPPGAASVALHRATGFVLTGTQPAVGYKQGQWLDVGLWQRPLAAPAVPPVDPCPLTDTELARLIRR